MPHHALVQRKTRNDWLSDHSLSILASLGDLLHGINAHDMDHVQRRPNKACQLNCPGRGFTFKDSRAGEGVSLRPNNPAPNHLLLAPHNCVSIFSVHHRDCTQLLAAPEAMDELLVVHHQRTLVSHEELEAVDTLLHDTPHRLGHARIPLCDSHVEPVINAGALSLALPRLKACLNVVVDWQRKVNVHGRAACGGGGLPCEEVVARGRSHERHVEMGVRLDAPRHYKLPFGIQNLGSCRHLHVRLDCRDNPILDQHVCQKLPVVVYHCAALD
mmetsp:Transcript_8065/g.24321  ORF Transcript_8065/g.24321 Transcript_8065/m.24321 type:complete len:272 (+) Transcript_8065:1635-2450(+)